MKASLLKLVASVVLISLLGSCKKEVESAAPNIFVAGYTLNDNGKNAIVYWKNGQETQLTDGSQDAFPSDIVVVDNNVYVTGEEFTGISNNSIAKYWKNGIATSLTDGSQHASASAVAVSGKDI